MLVVVSHPSTNANTPLALMVVIARCNLRWTWCFPRRTSAFTIMCIWQLALCGGGGGACGLPVIFTALICNLSIYFTLAPYFTNFVFHAILITSCIHMHRMTRSSSESCFVCVHTYASVLGGVKYTLLYAAICGGCLNI